MCLKLKVGLKLRCCAKLSFCEEYNGVRNVLFVVGDIAAAAVARIPDGESEDARRPFKSLQRHLNT
eukprot:10487357-Heterocapsa_arctica.AAC.1